MLLSRRRCCICYGLNRDTGIKQGQVGHLDHDRSNNDPDNLAFFCLDHHDQYDSKTSQSKRFTTSEVRGFRKELHEAIDSGWRRPVKFGAVEVAPSDHISGHYIRDGEFESAELDVRLIGRNRVKVEGFALWGKTRYYGPNIGELDFEAPLRNNRVRYRKKYEKNTYELKLTFRESGLTAQENFAIGFFGLNVTFQGEYEKVQ